MIRNLLTALVAGMLLAGTAFGQAYPSKPVRIVIPLPAGSGTDFMARLIAARLQSGLQQSVVVDNRPGGNSVIAAETVAKSPPDGYTLLLTYPDAFSINPLVYTKLSYDPERDFVPVSHVASQPYFIVAGPRAPQRTLPQLLAYAKANPGKLSYATSSLGAMLTGELIKLDSKVQMLHVPFRGGPVALTALLNGDVDFSISLVVPYATHAKDGKLFGLATTGVKREVLLPSTPTVRELGHPQLEFSLWNALFAPAGTPGAVIESLNAELRKVLSDPALTERLVATGTYPSASTPDYVRSLIRADLERWGRVIKQAGIKLD